MEREDMNGILNSDDLSERVGKEGVGTRRDEKGVKGS